MRLKFYLLWFEDNKEWAESKFRVIREIIEEYGFEWVIPKICRSEKSFNKNYEEYDLILMDYSLAEGSKDEKTGASIIKSIRFHECFTPILFYSQHGERILREEVARKCLDGVFCADKGDFFEKFEGLFVNNIKKIEDVNNLRGLVMSEVADLESIEEEIIGLYDLISCSEKSKITNDIISNMRKSNKKRGEFLESKNRETPLNDFLGILDLNKKSIIIHDVNSRGDLICKFIHSEFYKEIIQKRNLLAHVKEKIIKDKIVLEFRKNGKNLIFSQDEAKKIRKDILKYKNELEKLKGALENEPKNKIRIN